MAKLGAWVTVDTKEFLARKGRIDKGPHAPVSTKRLPWPMCSRCGLLYLKNARTYQAIKAPCTVEV